MLFSHDTELTLRAACALINSGRVEGEQLGDQPALDTYLGSWGWTGRRDHDDAELASVGEKNHRWIFDNMTDFILKKLKTGWETPEYRWSAMLNASPGRMPPNIDKAFDDLEQRFPAEDGVERLAKAGPAR